MSEAPQFAFPPRGAKMKTAWQLVWDALANGQQLDRNTLINLMTEQAGLKENTARNLLSQASIAGRLNAVKRGYDRDNPSVYERGDAHALPNWWKTWADNLSPESRARAAAYFQDRLDGLQTDGDHR